MSDLKQKTGYLICLYILWMLSGCSAGVNTNTSPMDESSETAEMAELENKKTARIDVSDYFTRQGITHYNSGNFNEALSILEKAISINPSNGTGYLYLAEVWIEKHNVLLAEKYNSLALIYLRSDNKKRDLAIRQQERIHLIQNPELN